MTRFKIEIKNLSVDLILFLKFSLGTVFYSAQLHNINIMIKSRSIGISHERKKKILDINISYTPKEVVHSFSSYVLSQEENDAFPYGLEHHTPCKVTRNSVNTEFESFYQGLLLDISTIPE